MNLTVSLGQWVTNLAALTSLGAFIKSLCPGHHTLINSAYLGLNWVSVVFIFLVRLGFELRTSAFAKEAFYHLSHISSPFCRGLFGDRIS
jgi:hypothetical protein